MKIKNLLILTAAFLAVIFVACDDDLSKLGNSIQPGDDDILAGGDTVTITASTYSFKDSVYARTIYGVLGEYEDPIFGRIKSDYLCEFRCPEDNELFHPNTFEIDSTSLFVGYSSFTGDTISPIGVTTYEVTESLKANFFTNVDPAKYCDMTKVLGQNIFTIQDCPVDSATSASWGVRVRQIRTKLNNELGERIFNKWKLNDGTFDSTDNFNKFFKGMYITNTFGSGSLINVDYTQLRIYFKYKIRNVANTEDSIVSGGISIGVTPEVIQMNHVENDIPPGLLADTEKSYMKTPAGLYTELTIPLEQIVKKANDKYGKGYTINAANFKMKGFTEEEEDLKTNKPARLLLINKDSLKNFFRDRKYDSNNATYAVISRDATSNSYNFGNLAAIINYYADHYKNETTIPNLHYLLIPVDVTQEQRYYNGQYVYVITDVFNYMSPTTAILRTDKDNMKMPLIFSKYNGRN